MSRILAVIPVYGEDSRLPEVIANVRQLQLPVLVVNDGNGPDLTRRLDADGISSIELVENRGVGAATRAGLRLAADRGYDGALAVDADMAHDIASVASARDAALRDPTRPVITTRFGWLSRAYVPEEKLAANGFACALFNHVTGYSSPDTSCGLRYYPADVAGNPWESDSYGFIPEFLTTLVTAGRAFELRDVFVDYDGPGPFLTRATELRDLLEWARRRGVATGVWQQLEPLTTTGAVRRTVPLVLESSEGRWSFDAVPGRDAWLISGNPPPLATRDHGLPSPRLLNRMADVAYDMNAPGTRWWAMRAWLRVLVARRSGIALRAYACIRIGEVCRSAALRGPAIGRPLVLVMAVGWLLAALVLTGSGQWESIQAVRAYSALCSIGLRLLEVWAPRLTSAVRPLARALAWAAARAGRRALSTGASGNRQMFARQQYAEVGIIHCVLRGSEVPRSVVEELTQIRLAYLRADDLRGVANCTAALGLARIVDGDPAGLAHLDEAEALYHRSRVDVDPDPSGLALVARRHLLTQRLGVGAVAHGGGA